MVCTIRDDRRANNFGHPVVPSEVRRGASTSNLAMSVFGAAGSAPANRTKPALASGARVRRYVIFTFPQLWQIQIDAKASPRPVDLLSL